MRSWGDVENKYSKIVRFSQNELDMVLKCESSNQLKVLNMLLWEKLDMVDYMVDYLKETKGEHQS